MGRLLQTNKEAMAGLGYLGKVNESDSGRESGKDTNGLGEGGAGPRAKGALKVVTDFLEMKFVKQ